MQGNGRHLDVEAQRALERKDPEAVRYFADHLSRPCDACEAFLSREDSPPDDHFGLDVLADEALVEAMAQPVQEDAVGWARLSRRLDRGAEGAAPTSTENEGGEARTRHGSNPEASASEDALGRSPVLQGRDTGVAGGLPPIAGATVASAGKPDEPRARHREAAPVTSRRATPRRAWLGGGLAAVAAVLLALLVIPQEQTPTQRVKGGAPLVVEVTAAARLPDGEVRAVAPGAVLSPEAVVLLRYHVSEAAHALLVREVPGASPETLGRYELLPGTHDLRDGEDLAGVSLEGEQGPLSLVLVAWPRGEQEAAPDPNGPAPDSAARAPLTLRVESGHAAP